jgi:hypothetical protein
VSRHESATLRPLGIPHAGGGASGWGWSVVKRAGEVTVSQPLKKLQKRTFALVIALEERDGLRDIPPPCCNLIGLDDYTDMGIEISSGCASHCEIRDVPTSHL